MILIITKRTGKGNKRRRRKKKKGKKKHPKRNQSPPLYKFYIAETCPFPGLVLVPLQEKR
jgi:hypothetical protein